MEGGIKILARSAGLAPWTIPVTGNHYSSSPGGAGAPSCAFAEGGSTGTGSDQRTLRGHKREKWEVGEEREGGVGGGECCAVVLRMQALGGNSL